MAMDIMVPVIILPKSILHHCNFSADCTFFLFTMIILKEDFSLKSYNSFGLDVKADLYFYYTEINDLIDFLKSRAFKSQPCFVMGGGNNLLFISDFHGVVLHSGIGGIDIIDESSDDVIVAVGAGVDWDSFVAWSVENGFGGVENLSLIPGSVGASPVQNIGAYGVELKDVFYKAEGVYIDTCETFNISAQGCDFGYRYSVFKGPLKNKAILTRVLFRLSKNPVFKMEYGSVKNEVDKMGGISLVNIRNAIVTIRRSKLPDPSITGNVGSFFKNPIVKREHYLSLSKEYTDIPFYETGDFNMVKIPAGWLIEKSGWKGKSRGRAGVHNQQALVLINLGGATGSDIINLANEIENDVKRLFDIYLEKEVNVIG